MIGGSGLSDGPMRWVVDAGGAVAATLAYDAGSDSASCASAAPQSSIDAGIGIP